MRVEQTKRQDVPNADSVLKFLTHNPDFFNQHSDVLPRLSIPHQVGGQTVSLIEKQVSVLRTKCSTLENNLRDLITVARENEQLHQRLHQLIQDIITASSLDDIVELTRSSLLTNFNADEVKLILITPETENDSELGFMRLDHTNPGIGLFSENFGNPETRCGDLTGAQKTLIFGEEAHCVASAAIIPLVHNRKLGLVVLASKDEERFAQGKGVMFLNQLGEVLSRRIDTLI